MPGLSASEMIRQRQSRLSSTAAAGQSPGRQRQRQQPSSAGSTADLTATARDAILGGSPPNEQDDRARSRGEDEPPSRPTPTDPVSAKKDARNLSEESETERQGPSHDRPTLQEGECGDTAVGDSSLPLLTTGPSPLPSTKSQSGHSESSHLAIPTNSIRSSLDRPDALTPRSRTADESGTANFTDRLVGRRHNTSLQQNDDGLVTSAASVSSGMSAAWRSSRASCDDGTEVAGQAVVDDEAASKTLAISAGGGIDGEDEQDELGESEPQGSAIDVVGVGGQDVIDDSRPDEADVEAPNNEAGQDVGAEAVATKTSLVVIDGVTVKVNDDAPLASIGRSHDDGQDLNDESKRALPWYKRPCGKIFIVLVAGAVIAAGLLAKRPWESTTPRADEVGQGSENETVNDPSHAQNETIAVEPEVPSPELVSYSTAAPSISAIPITQSTNRPTASLEQPTTREPTNPPPSQSTRTPTAQPTSSLVPLVDFGYVGVGSCRDEKSRPYNSIQFPGSSKYDCQGPCVVFLDGLVGYHYDENFESCFCNVGNGVLLGSTGFGKCPTGFQCITGNDGFGPVFSSSGDERVYCYKVLS